MIITEDATAGGNEKGQSRR